MPNETDTIATAILITAHAIFVIFTLIPRG